MTDSSHLTGARAAVLARLWCALVREPLPGITDRHRDGDRIQIGWADGTQLRGPAAAAEPFTPAPTGLTLHYGSDGYRDPAALVRVLPLGPLAGRLADELENSVANLALARSAVPRPDGGPPYLSRRPGLAEIEQCIVDGHPLHPLCRTRMGMSTEEVRRYAPEHRPVVRLLVVKVPAHRWLSTGAGLPPRLPMHPWQYEHVLDRYPYLRPTGELIPARPLMSLRTVELVKTPQVHLKTAVDVQMTSAVRTVSAAAIHNGPAISAVLSRLAHGTGVQPAAEFTGGAVLVDDEPCPSLAVLRRHAPRLRDPANGNGELALPLAALAAPSPASGRPLLTELADPEPEPFFAALVGCLVPPPLRLLHRGVALEAHGQNTLLVLRDGWPDRLVYRDLGGIRLLPARLRAAGGQLPAIHGDLRAEEPDQLQDKLFAALVSTVLSELVALMTREYGLEPARLWKQVAATARGCFAQLAGSGSTGAGRDERALFGPTIAAKALTAMRLSDTPVRDIWVRQPNPLAGLG
ncbi:MAG: IucA/IucC family siderophore biosynthesis protein [Micromonosporaceae bacterium]|nr:IucA/IucC family siderophore biosynthesis protein [Micromonosporaceae bacterium]